MLHLLANFLIGLAAVLIAEVAWRLIAGGVDAANTRRYRITVGERPRDHTDTDDRED